MPDFLRGRVHPVALFANILVAFFGLFQIVFTVAVRTGWSFETFLPSVLLVGLGAAATVFWVHRQDEAPEPAPEELQAPADWQLKWGLATAPAVAIASLLMDAQTIGYGSFLAVVLVHLGILAWGTRPRISWNREPLDLYSGLGLLGAIAAGVVASLVIIRPEGDDGYYVAQAVGTIEHPELPLLSFDVMHNQLDWPVQQLAHRAQGFETWCSVLFDVLPMHHFDIYYLLQCGFFGGCIAIANFLFVRAIAGQRVAATAAMVLVGVLVVWGGAYYSWGNFTYARIFQGKGVLVGVFAPLCAWRALAFVAEQNARTWWMLLLAQSAVAFCTSTGLIVAPVCAAFVVLAGLSLDKRGALMAVAGAMTSLPVLAMLWMVKLDLATIETAKGSTGLKRGIREAFGGSGRVGIALIAVLLAPLLLRWWRSEGSHWAARYLFFVFALLINEYTTHFIADIAGDLYTWRTYWAVPLAPFIGTTVALAAQTAISDRAPVWRALSLGGVMVWLLSHTASGHMTWDTRNNAHIQWMEHKIRYQQNLVAQAVLKHMGPDDVVVLPDNVTLRVTMYRDKPTILGVRRIYTEHLRPVMGEEMYQAHMRFIDFATGLERAKVDWALAELDNRCVTGIVIHRRVRSRFPEVVPHLHKRWFDYVPIGRKHKAGYQFFKRDASKCNAPDRATGSRPPVVKPVSDPTPQPDDDTGEETIE